MIHLPRRALESSLTLISFAAVTIGGSALAEGAVPAVDPYQPYVAPAGCEPFVEQPGVEDFRDMILSRAGGSSGGIHACSGEEHEEGRAWDWMRDASNPAEAAQVHLVLDWLLATDADGHPHAMARRLGLAYIVWNHKSISFFGSNRSWKPYPCDGSPEGCHTNHVHFAFAWAGALRQTTWFTSANRPASWFPAGDDAGASAPAGAPRIRTTRIRAALASSRAP